MIKLKAHSLLQCGKLENFLSHSLLQCRKLENFLSLYKTQLMATAARIKCSLCESPFRYGWSYLHDCPV